jgi:L-seryl-tRNA(Ser) seleniumtransferase
VRDYLEADATDLRKRCEALAAGLPPSLGATVVTSAGVVGGGGAPGLTLDGWAVALPDWCAAALRTGTVPVLARVERGSCLVDLRCIPPEADPLVAQAISAVAP